MKIKVHYNKFTVKQGKPWTVHTSKACYAASHVRFNVPVETEEKPENRSNPRYFIKCDGKISWDGTVAIIQ